MYDQWIISRPSYDVEARADASHDSYALGKHNWTIWADAFECLKSLRDAEYKKEYTIEMKLTGCKADEFTCDDGQCVKMEKRCNQLQDCRDKSDEKKCQILILDPSTTKEFHRLLH